MPRPVPDRRIEEARHRLVRGQLATFMRFYVGAAGLLLAVGLLFGDGEAVALSGLNLLLGVLLFRRLGRRRLEWSAGLLSLVLLATAAWTTWTNPLGLADATVVLYGAVVVFAALLLRGPWLHTVLALDVLTVVVVGLRRPLGLVGPEALDPATPLDVVVIAVVLVLCTLWIRRQNRILLDSLRRSLVQERQLQRQHEDLESHVQRVLASERRWRSLVQAVPDWVLQVETGGEVVFASREGLGSGGSVVGGRLPDLAAGADARRLEEALARVAGGEDASTVEAVLETGRGRRHCLLHFGAMEEHRKVVGAIVLVVDETERRQLREQLERAQRLDSLGRLAGGIAHDFRNLLTVVRGHVDLAQDLARHGEDPQAELDRARQACLRAGELAQRILAFGRREALHPRRIQANEVLEGLREMLHHVVGPQIQLEVVLADGLPPVDLDPGRLEQVVMNLVLNARDAVAQNPPGRPRRITITSRGNGGGVGLEIADTGCGMDEPMRERIFEPFFTTKPAGEGTGLGLSVVYGIVQQSGGELDVDSRPGRGSTFRIHFPAAPPSAAAEGAGA